MLFVVCLFFVFVLFVCFMCKVKTTTVYKSLSLGNKWTIVNIVEYWSCRVIYLCIYLLLIVLSSPCIRQNTRFCACARTVSILATDALFQLPENSNINVPWWEHGSMLLFLCRNWYGDCERKYILMQENIYDNWFNMVCVFITTC